MASLPEASLAVLYLTLPYHTLSVLSKASQATCPLPIKHREEGWEERKDIGCCHNRPKGRKYLFLTNNFQQHGRYQTANERRDEPLLPPSVSPLTLLFSTHGLCSTRVLAASL
ncbi:hypothetical protein FOPG_10508 [Fusarium oxysporum f. sp. conglutinans race 2 54008]|uniref:Uncharacterized protein n=1 Tax=Fusarium oxysporum f. sp. conglutinans race 2 54008 TaxID=1089457 RepID=X0IMR9_FUSOX|nr:hypothetical protein FOPG_10508 [Fusarium oxysporum f. sp. conglutinans race 2 54008]